MLDHSWFISWPNHIITPSNSFDLIRDHNLSNHLIGEYVFVYKHYWLEANSGQMYITRGLSQMSELVFTVANLKNAISGIQL